MATDLSEAHTKKARVHVVTAEIVFYFEDDDFVCVQDQPKKSKQTTW